MIEKLERLSLWWAAMAERVKAQPWKPIGIAAAVGFVLGAIAGSR